MNLADSVKFVLKSKSQNIFSEFWKEDLRNLLIEVRGDFSYLYRSAKIQIKKIRYSRLRFSPQEMVESASDALTIFKVIPVRVKDGFTQFRDDFIRELDGLPDQKQKTIFCVKVLGALSRFIVVALYNLRMGSVELPFLKRRNAFTQFLVAELIFKISQIFVIRFLVEVEKHLTDPDDLNNLRYFKNLLSNREKLEDEQGTVSLDQDDHSILIVEDLKNFIVSGKRRLN